MHLRTYYPTVVLSDIHLGTSHSKTIEVSNFLKSVNCDRLILNGDIIDGWHLRKAGTKKWQAKHTDFFKVIMKMMENFGTEVIYVRGNHDDFLDSLVPMTFYNVKIVKEYILETHGKRYYVTHGDLFDRVTTQMKWLAGWAMQVIHSSYGRTAFITNIVPSGGNRIILCHRPSNKK